MITKLEAGEAFEAKHMNLLDAFCLVNEAWNDVSADIIQNCFRKAGFNLGSFNKSGTIVEESYDSLWDELRKQTIVTFDSFEAYVDVDENEQCFESLTDVEIIAMVESNEDSDNETIIYDEGEEEPKQEFPTRSQALSYIQSLQRYFGSIYDCNDSDYDMLGKLEKKVIMSSNKLKQSTLTDYYNPTDKD
jgi:hypothetical protein